MNSPIRHVNKGGMLEFGQDSTVAKPTAIDHVFIRHEQAAGTLPCLKNGRGRMHNERHYGRTRGTPQLPEPAQCNAYSNPESPTVAQLSRRARIF